MFVISIYTFSLIASIILSLIQNILFILNKKQAWLFYMLNTVISWLLVVKQIEYNILETTLYTLIGITGILIWFPLNKLNDNKSIHRIRNKLKLDNRQEIRWGSYKEKVILINVVFVLFIVYYIPYCFNVSQQTISTILILALTLTANLAISFKLVDAWILLICINIYALILNIQNLYYQINQISFISIALSMIYLIIYVMALSSWVRIAKLKDVYRIF